MKILHTFVAVATFFASGCACHAAARTLTLSVPGMSCGTCPITVKKALSKVEGVSKAEVSLEKKEAVVTFDDAKAKVEALLEATKNAGYPSTVKP
jgi:mercuric ion binding protein